jgi:hypothetical protein
MCKTNRRRSIGGEVSKSRLPAVSYKRVTGLPGLVPQPDTYAEAGLFGRQK